MIQDYTYGHITQKDLLIIFSRDLDREVFNTAVQSCRNPQLDMVQEGQPIPKNRWMRWDPESMTIQSAQEECQVQPTSSASDSSSSSDTIIYDLESLMDTESVDNDNSDQSGLPDINQLRDELAFPAWLSNSMASPPHDFVVPADYSPASPVYSPTSPAYSHRHSPITISDSDSEYGFIPAPNSDGPFTTRASDIFNLPNEDSDLENDGEVELINLVGNYKNRHRLPIQINGVYLFPQPTNMHDLT